MPDLHGSPIVCTADRTLTAGYSLLFDGMLAAGQTTLTPAVIMNTLLMPCGEISPAPLGLRRVEAALISGGFHRQEVAVTDEGHLHEAIGPATKIIAISAGEPLGLGMNSSTMTGVTGGMIYPQREFLRLLRKINGLKIRRTPDAKIIMGGPGAWQLAQDDEARQKLGIDHVVTGYSEGNIATIMQALMNGESPPTVIEGRAAAEDIRSILGPTSMGAVEISRGCGLGCSFCTLAPFPMRHLPLEMILADVRMNVSAGQANIALLSEDLFRYGGAGARANPAALIDLLQNVRAIPGVRLIQVDHANVSGIAQYSDVELRTVRELLVGDTGSQYPWINIGVETASGRLLREMGGAGKMGGKSAEEWGEYATAQVRRAMDAGFFPMISLLLGAPGETEEDLRATLRWVEQFARDSVSAFPILYAPVDGSEIPTARQFSPLHWTMMQKCYALNFRWIPRMYWDNQTAAGVPPWRRMVLQALGKGQVAQWTALLAWRKWRARG